MEKIPNSERPVSKYEFVRNLNQGDVFHINGVDHVVEKIESGTELAEQFDLRIDRDIPVFHLKGFGRAQGGYHPEADIIVMFENNTDPGTLEHELVHAVEYKFDPTPALLELFEKAKELIDEDAIRTENGSVNWNFTKNIHEFIAEGKTKLVPALKDKELYDDFVRETAYIFSA